MMWHGHDPSQHHQLKKMLCKIRKLRKSIIYYLRLMLRRKMLKKDAKKIEKIYLSYGWNVQFQKRHNNAQQYFNYLIRGSLRKLYKYPVKPRKYWETLLYKDLLNNLSCYLSCLHASVSSNISAFGRKYFAFQEANFVSAVKAMFSDVGDTNISATLFLTFDKGFSLQKNI